MELTIYLALGLIAVAVAAILRGLDVRLVLFASALALGGLAGDVAPVIREFLGRFSDEKFVIPICAAMGFARVLGHTGCDRHLVRLLIGPVRRVRFLMVPGVVLVCFLVNIPIISQSSTAVCLGTVVVPVMRAAGFAPLTIGAALVLGSSVGGELFNPGAPELLTVSAQTGVPTTDMWRDMMRLVLPVLIVSTLVFWARELWAGKRQTDPLPDTEEKPADEERVNIFKALVPIVPLVLLFLSGPPLHWLTVPPALVVAPASGKTAAATSSVYATRLIGLAMLVGVAVALIASPTRFKGLMKAFFDGAGYGFTHIISLIVTASCFGKGIELVGLARVLGDLIAAGTGWLYPLAGFIPASFAFVSGSGMASTQSLYGFFYGPAVALGENPVSIGAMVSVGAAAGRTMSPVSAVVLMGASLTGTRPFDLVRSVGPPLAIGLTVTVLLRTLGIL